MDCSYEGDLLAKSGVSPILLDGNQMRRIRKFIMGFSLVHRIINLKSGLILMLWKGNRTVAITRNYGR